MVTLTTLLAGLLLSTSDPALPERAHLWECEGVVRLNQRALDCWPVMTVPLHAGDRLTVETGSAWITDSDGKQLRLNARTFPIYEVPSLPPAKQRRPLDFDLAEIFDAVFDRAVEAILKGPRSDDLDAFPWLDFLDADGPALSAWEGTVVWRNLPPRRPLALRAYAGDRLVFGPEPLIEPIFDLGQLARSGARELRLELLLLDAPVFPSDSTLRLPIELLLGPGQPVTAVLISELCLQTSQEARAAEQALAAASGLISPLDRAAITTYHGRLNAARGILHQAYGSEQRPIWQRAVAGLVVAGELYPQSVLDLSALDEPKAAGEDDPWTALWRYLGPSVVPEIPLADLAAADELADRLAESEPGGWRPRVVRAQLHLLRGYHARARAELTAARHLCGSYPACDSTVEVLDYFVEVDSYSGFNRELISDSMSSAPDPTIQASLIERSSRARKALESVAPEIQNAAQLWFTAAEVRSIRVGVQATRFVFTEESRRRFADALQTKMVLARNPTPPQELLRWSVFPYKPPPLLPVELRPVAMFLHAEAILAPNGGYGTADVNTLAKPDDMAPYYSEGLPSPSIAIAEEPQFHRARNLLALYRGNSDNPPFQFRRMALLAFGQVSIGQVEKAQTSLRHAERFLSKTNYTISDRAVFEIASTAISLSSKQRTVSAEQVLESFQQAVSAASKAGSQGRVAAVLAAWAECARRTFHHQGRYRDGLNLMNKLTEEATDQGFLAFSIQIIPERLEMASDLGLHQTIIAEMPQAIRSMGKLKAKLREHDSALAALAARVLGPEQEHSNPDPDLVTLNEILLARRAIESLAELGVSTETWEKQIATWTELMTEAFGRWGGRLLANEIRSEDLARLYSERGNMLTAERIANEGESFISRSSRGIFALARGDQQFLGDLERQIDGYEALLRHRAQSSSATAFQFRRSAIDSVTSQALLFARELYIRLCAKGGMPRRSRTELAAWNSDAFSGSLAESQPWRQLLFRAFVLESEKRFDEAGEVFDKLTAEIQDVIFSGQLRNRHRNLVSMQEDAFLGSARMAMSSDFGEAGSLKALDRIDELRWLNGERRAFEMAAGVPPLPDLATVASALGQNGHLVIFGGLGKFRETTVWLYSTDTSLRARQFFSRPEEKWFVESLRLAINDQEPPGPTFSQICDWLAAEIPRDAPVALILSPRLRALNLHALPLEGEPLALRNPVVIAPSLRVLAQVQQVEPSGDGPLIVGLPLYSRGIDDLPGISSPLSGLSELERLARLEGVSEDRFLWAQKATLQTVLQKLEEASWVHLSAHGEVDPLAASRTGIRLHGGDFLTLATLADVRLPGTLVVLSSCATGDWGSAMASNVATLDLGFLARGASSVVSASRKVEVDVAETWMQSFHAALHRGEIPMAAARVAYQDTRARFPEPARWAAFVVVGSGRGRF